MSVCTGEPVRSAERAVEPPRLWFWRLLGQVQLWIRDDLEGASCHVVISFTGDPPRVEISPEAARSAHLLLEAVGAVKDRLADFGLELTREEAEAITALEAIPKALLEKRSWTDIIERLLRYREHFWNNRHNMGPAVDSISDDKEWYKLWAHYCDCYSRLADRLTDDDLDKLTDVIDAFEALERYSNQTSYLKGLLDGIIVGVRNSA